MFGRKKKKKKDRFRSKYMDEDFDSMSDEEFLERASKIYKESIIRGVSGTMLFIIGLAILIVACTYLW